VLIQVADCECCLSLCLCRCLYDSISVCWWFHVWVHLYVCVCRHGCIFAVCFVVHVSSVCLCVFICIYECQ